MQIQDLQPLGSVVSVNEGKESPLVHVCAPDKPTHKTARSMAINIFALLRQGVHLQCLHRS